MRYELVPFHDRFIPTVQVDGKVHVIMKPVAEGIGLAWNGQLTRLSRNPVLTKGMHKMFIPSEGGPQEMIVADLKTFAGWLVTISPGHIPDPEKRAVIMRYQEESFEVIEAHWFHGGRGAQKPGVSAIDARRSLPLLLTKLKRETNAEVRRVLHQMASADCAVLGIDPPILELIGRADPGIDEIAAPFFDALRILTLRGVAWNLHRRPAKFWAVRLLTLEAHCKAYNIPFDNTPELRRALEQSRHPRFVRASTLNTVEGGYVHCWIFEAPTKRVD